MRPRIGLGSIGPWWGLGAGLSGVFEAGSTQLRWLVYREAGRLWGLKDQDVPDRYISELVGHSVEGEKSRYGKRYNPQKLLEVAVLKLDWQDEIPELGRLRASRYARPV